MSSKQKEFIRKYRRNKLIIFLVQILITISFLLLWELLSKYKIINPFIFSAPSRVIKTIIQLLKTGNLLSHILTTLIEVIISFGLGFIIGLSLAIIFYLFPNGYKVMDPFITMINSLPKVALGPMIIIWFGANTKSIIIMALLINLIVSMVSIYTGFCKTDKNQLLLFKSFGASKGDLMRYLVIPGSFNSIISSCKLNISLSFIGVIMGEFLVSKKGIGYLIIYGTQVFNLDLVMAGVVILVILSYLLYKPISYLESKNK